VASTRGLRSTDYGVVPAGSLSPDTAELRVRTSQYEDENERCSVSNHKVQSKDFSQYTVRSTICLTFNAISSPVAHFEFSATRPWRSGES
jgi:hypothetical protein